MFFKNILRHILLNRNSFEYINSDNEDAYKTNNTVSLSNFKY